MIRRRKRVPESQPLSISTADQYRRDSSLALDAVASLTSKTPVAVEHRNDNGDSTQSRIFRCRSAMGVNCSDAPPRRAGNSTRIPQQHIAVDYVYEPIEIRQGCLLIPIFFAAWWFWTKRMARRVVKGMISTGTTPCTNPDESSETRDVDDEIRQSSGYWHADNNGEKDEENRGYQDHDEYTSWDDVMQHSSQDPSVHFVRWFKAENYGTQREVKTVSKRTMRRRILSFPRRKAAGDNHGGSKQSPILDAPHDQNSPQPPNALPSSLNSETSQRSRSGSGFNTSGASPPSVFPMDQPVSSCAWECIEDTTMGIEVLASSDPLSPSNANVLEHEHSQANNSICSFITPVLGERTDHLSSDADTDVSSVKINPIV